MNRTQIGLVAATIICFFSNVAFAGDSGVYVGIGAGSSATDVKDLSTGTTTKYTSSGFRILGGNQINQNFALEVEYVDLGKFNDPTVSVASTGFGVSGVGIMPLQNNFSLYGKIGIASINTTATAAPGWVLLVNPSESKTGVSYGFGAQFEISSKATLRLSVDSYEYSALAGYVTGRVGMYSAAGIFKF